MNDNKKPDRSWRGYSGTAYVNDPLGVLDKPSSGFQKIKSEPKKVDPVIPGRGHWPY